MNETENNNHSMNGIGETATQSVKTVSVNNIVYKVSTDGVLQMERFYTKFASLAKIACVTYIILCVMIALGSIGIFNYAGHSGEYFHSSSIKVRFINSLMDWCMELILSDGIFTHLIVPAAESFFSISVALALYSGLKDFSSNWNKLVTANLAAAVIFALLGFCYIESFTYDKIESIISGGLWLLIGIGIRGNFKGKDPEAISFAMIGFGVIVIVGTLLSIHYLVKIEDFLIEEGMKGYGLTSGIQCFLYAFISYKLYKHLRGDDEYDKEEE